LGDVLFSFHNMTIEQEALWTKLNNLELDEPAASFSFSDRLARENGWTFSFAIRAVEEYKKFIFLICISSHPLTPSDEVDQVWHLHLLYTQSYWIDMCKKILQREIHHGPTRGGNAERNKFKNWYQETKDLYTKTFGQAPPADIWPNEEKRFRDIHFQRVNVKTHWIIAKPPFLNR
jgi:hypothetical protein